MRLASALLLVICASLALGGTCGGGGAPLALVRFEPSTLTVAPGTPILLDVVVETDELLRAFDLSVRMDDAAVAAPTGAGALPHTDFDDDGMLFLTPIVDVGAGRVSRIVDVIHGSSGVTGVVTIATLELQSGSEGTTKLSLPVARLMTDGAQELVVQLVAPTITVTP